MQIKFQWGLLIIWIRNKYRYDTNVIHLQYNYTRIITYYNNTLFIVLLNFFNKTKSSSNKAIMVISMTIVTFNLRFVYRHSFSLKINNLFFYFVVPVFAFPFSFSMSNNSCSSFSQRIIFYSWINREFYNSSMENKSMSFNSSITQKIIKICY